MEKRQALISKLKTEAKTSTPKQSMMLVPGKVIAVQANAAGSAGAWVNSNVGSLAVFEFLTDAPDAFSAKCFKRPDKENQGSTKSNRKH